MTVRKGPFATVIEQAIYEVALPLAKADEPITTNLQGGWICALCKAPLRRTVNHEQLHAHQADCPWRRARELNGGRRG